LKTKTIFLKELLGECCKEKNEGEKLIDELFKYLKDFDKVILDFSEIVQIGVRFVNGTYVEFKKRTELFSIQRVWEVKEKIEILNCKNRMVSELIKRIFKKESNLQ